MDGDESAVFPWVPKVWGSYRVAELDGGPETGQKGTKKHESKKFRRGRKYRGRGIKELEANARRRDRGAETVRSMLSCASGG
jgi:hypothetical protein